MKVRSLHDDGKTSLRYLLFHLKSLFWCLHQDGMHYNLSLVLSALMTRRIPPQIENSNLSDSLGVLLSQLDAENLYCIASALSSMTNSAASIELGERHFEIGHYLQCITAIGPITAGSYGIVSCTTPQLRGLFYVTQGHSEIHELLIAPFQVRTLFGLYVA